MRATRSTRSCPRPLSASARVRREQPRRDSRSRPARCTTGQAAVHVAVAERARAVQPLLLALARSHHPRPHRVRARRAPRAAADQLARRHRRDLAHQVDPVEQRTAEPPHVARQLGLGAPAAVARPRARAAVARGHEHRVRRERRASAGPRMISIAPSSSGCRSASSALRANSGSSSRNSTPRWASVISPGRGRATAADEPLRGDRVVGRAEGALAHRACPSPSPAALWICVISSASSNVERRAGSPAAAARASSCPPRADRPSAGCARRPRRSRAPASRPPGRGRRRGRAPVARPCCAAAPGATGSGVQSLVQEVARSRRGSAPRSPRGPRPAPPRRRSRAGRAGARARPRARRSPRASAPRTGRSSPLSDSSPQSAAALERARAGPARSRRAARRRSPGRSDGPALRRWAGARLTVSRFIGNSSSEFSSAARTRSRDSRIGPIGQPDERERRAARDARRPRR